MHFEMFGASILVGLMSGWLAGIAMKGGGYGLLWDIIFGLSGSVVGSWIFLKPWGRRRRLGAGQVLLRSSGRALMMTLQRKIWPAQVAHAYSRNVIRIPLGVGRGVRTLPHKAWREARGVLRRAGVSKRGGGGNVRE